MDHKTMEELFEGTPGRPFDRAQARPLDTAQDGPFDGAKEIRKDKGGTWKPDGAQGGPFDKAQGSQAAEIPGQTLEMVDDHTPPGEMDPQAVSPRQRLALEAFCNGGTIGDAAAAANVSRQTLHRWRAKYPHFALAMSSWSSACLSTAESQMAELASRAVGALSNAIDKGDARTATAVLRSLGVLRTYQPSKAPAGGAEKTVAVPGMNFLAQALAGAAPEQLNPGAPGNSEQAKEAAAIPPAAGKEVWPATVNSGGTAAKQEAPETQRTGCQTAGALRHQDLTSEPAKEHKPAILAGKAGSAIKRACASALRDVTECYQMLPNGTEQNVSPGGMSLASCG